MEKMYDIKEEPEKVILVAVSDGDEDKVNESLDELEELVDTAGAVTVGKRPRSHVSPLQELSTSTRSTACRRGSSRTSCGSPTPTSSPGSPPPSSSTTGSRCSGVPTSWATPFPPLPWSRATSSPPTPGNGTSSAAA